jgi:hypothetical protein
MKHRKLRIAWSAGWGVAVVLLAALWLRSYWRSDMLQLWLPGSRGALVTSRAGLLRWAIAENLPRQFAFLSTKVVDLSVTPQTTHYGFAHEFVSVGNRVSVTAPYWCLILLATCFAFAPWSRSRFSLRTLLIATTLVASLLALVVLQR